MAAILRRGALLPLTAASRARMIGRSSPAMRLSDAASNEALNAPRETMFYDVVIIGGGPSGLSAAIRLKQLGAETGKDLSVCVVEKGPEIGSHILSGNVFEPRALTELLPNWKELGAPIDTPVADDVFLFLTEKRAFELPRALLPPMLHNEGNYVISLGKLVRWLGKQAEEAGLHLSSDMIDQTIA